MKNLTNKIAVVTGGSRGIGADITKALARAGANVTFTYANSLDRAEGIVGELKQENIIVRASKVDSANASALSQVIDEIGLAYGRIDILVNNAGVFVSKVFNEYTMVDYDLTMDINVRAVFAGSLAAARHMINGGRILTIGSNMADFVGRPKAALYAMSKSALQGFTKGLARDLGELGVTVNLIQPGPIDTEMNPANSPKAKLAIDRMAVSSYGDVSDVSALVVFLVSKEARYITGSCVTIDGGFNA